MLKDVGEGKQTTFPSRNATKMLGNLSVTLTWLNAKDLVYEFMTVLGVVNLADPSGRCPLAEGRSILGDIFAVIVV